MHSFMFSVILLALQFDWTTALIQLGDNSSCSRTCDELRRTLPPSTVTTVQTLNFYWAQQQSALTPTCYANPASAHEVSVVLVAAKKYNCKLAIRGGGHSDVPGASNIQDGLVLNLGRLKNVTMDNEKHTVQIGAGCNWGDVYKVLDPYNKTTVGGREESVGVAGLLLGGGLSYFSGTRGFACDNVKLFEVVLASGEIVRVTHNSKYGDLFKALRGGGNNFAVVTRFDVDMLSYDGMYGGINVWSDSPEVESEVVQAFVDFTHDAPTAPHANLFTSVNFFGTSFIWTAGLSYTLPDPKPEIFKSFYSANLSAAQLISTQRVTTHGNLAAELDKTQPSNLRNQFTTATFVSNAELQHRMVAIFKEEVKNAQPKILVQTGFAPGIAFQPLTQNMLAQQIRRGGNVMGLSTGEAPLMIVGFLWQWSSSLDDQVVLQGIQNVLDRSSAAAKEMGLLNDFVYQNYAAPYQAPITSYGKQNRDFLRQVSQKYDPNGVFQTLVAGGFKLT